MLKKLVSVLALTSLAFGSGLCFNPYNHDYGISTEKIPDGGILDNYNKIIILHNGKMQIGKKAKINLLKYVVNGNKALTLMRGKGEYFGNEYFVIYTECINGKPVTKDMELIGTFSTSMATVNLPKYPIKLGFYKNGFWVKSLFVGFQNGWYHHPGGYYCYYTTQYFPYKLIKEHKGYDGPMKFHNLPTRVCKVLGHEVGI